MRNLVAAHRGVLGVRSSTVPDLPLASAVFDSVADRMVCTFGPNEDFNSIEMQIIEVSFVLQDCSFIIGEAED